jgi:CBS domain-containing protein
MVTDRDLFIALGTQNRKPAEMQVGEVMSKDISMCSPDDDLRTALRMMAQKQAHRLPVVDKNGDLKGILSIDDVVVKARREGLTNEVIDALSNICEHASYQMSHN